MFKTDLLSHVDLDSMMNATNADNIIDDNHVQAVLNLLVTENTPYILSQKELADKIENLHFATDVPHEKKAQIKKILSDLSLLPTGQKLLSLLPNTIIFTSYEDTNRAYFSRTGLNINIDLSKQKNPAERVADMAHEIRHALQYKYDPTFTNYAHTSYIFEKIIELDCCLQDIKVEREYWDILEPNNEIMRKAHERKNPHYYKYFNMLQNNSGLSDEEKERLSGTFCAIDLWYGISDNFWRNTYDEVAKKLKGFSRVPNALVCSVDSRLSELDKYIRQSYIQNMGISLSSDFFDSGKDCTLYFKGHKIFERKSNSFRSDIIVFSLTDCPMYQSRLNYDDKKEEETYFYPSGQKQAFYNYQGSKTRRGRYVLYYDKTQRIKEEGQFAFNSTKGEIRGVGQIFADDDKKTVIGESYYYQSGRLEYQHFTAGEHKGQCIFFYDTTSHNIRCKMQSNGCGYFEIYRNDDKNSLEWSGSQINCKWNGECIKYDSNGNLVQKKFFDMGVERPDRSSTYLDEVRIKKSSNYR